MVTILSGVINFLEVTTLEIFFLSSVVIKEVCARGACIEDVSAYVGNPCTEDIYAWGNCGKGICIRGTCIKAFYGKNTCIKDASVGDTCVRVTCIGNTSTR